LGAGNRSAQIVHRPSQANGAEPSEHEQIRIAPADVNESPGENWQQDVQSQEGESKFHSLESARRKTRIQRRNHLVNVVLVELSIMPVRFRLCSLLSPCDK
jgi:hypothetical protein